MHVYLLELKIKDLFRFLGRRGGRIGVGTVRALAVVTVYMPLMAERHFF